MSQVIIGAEIVPLPRKAAECAKALQKLGLKVLHIADTSISVQGLETVWRENFRVAFESKSKQQHPSSGGDPVPYRRPLSASIPVPVGLSELIESVHFVEPPEFF